MLIHLLLLQLLHISHQQQQQPSSFTTRVTTSRGVVRGFRVDYGSNRSQLYYGAADVFLGIPFAQPPVGEWRFKLPRPICRYAAEVGELSYKPRCIQQSPPALQAARTDEDCLYLNVFTPDTTLPRRYPVMTTVPRRFPVMVWVHGGAFASGGADQFHYKGAIRNLISNGVIVVTLQYRLGMLGFFTTYTPEFPANRGLFDQLLAFRWVKEEIAAFGGDPDRITAFGESAGAVSISGLSLSPLARGLFNRMAITSGSVYLSFQVPNDVRGSIERDRAAQLCNITGDPMVQPALRAQLLNCLQTMPTSQLISKEAPPFTPLLASVPKPTNINWSPVRDGVMFPADPEVLARTRPPMDALIGDMKEEYAFFMSEYMSGNISYIGASSLREALLNRGKGYLTEEQLSLISDRMIRAYQTQPPAANDNMGWFKVIVDAMTGEMISSVMRRDVQWLKSSGARVFLFTFDHPSTACNIMPNRLQGFNGTVHGADICFLWFTDWDRAAAQGKISQSDLAVANNAGRVWTNFAKFGNAGWTESGSSYSFMKFDDKLNTMGRDWRGTADRLYNKEFPRLIGDYPPTRVSPIVEEILKVQGAKVLDQWNRNLAMCRR